MKAVGRAVLFAIFLVLTGVMVAAARYAPERVFAFYPAWSRKALAAVSSVTAVVPFSLWEVAVRDWRCSGWSIRSSACSGAMAAAFSPGSRGSC
ncbi:MAG: hypothetical protein V8T01_09295 [Oscillospiraceae bacterium]